MQAPGSWLNHNRYAYCLQNPVMYADPEGESILAAMAIGAFIGGGLNYGIKKYNGQINSVGDAFAAFGWGALGGAAGTYAAVTLGPALAGYGFMGGFVMGMASSYANSLVLSFGNNRSFGDPVMGPKELMLNCVASGLMGGVGNGILTKIAGRNFWNGQSVAQDVATTAEPVAVGEVGTETSNVSRTQKSLINQSYNEVNYTLETKSIGSGTQTFSSELYNEYAINDFKPSIKGYSTRLESQVDLYHGFPKELDGEIIQNGICRISKHNLSATYLHLGYINGENGVYTIMINNDGIVYHRCFYPLQKFYSQFYFK